MAGQFEATLKGFGIKSMGTLDKVRRSSVLELFKLVIYATPVEDGHLRGNWQTTINTPATGTLSSVDKVGDATVADAMANLGGMMDVVWFVNNLPYAERIEYDGWSQHKAPQGMVRRHLAMWQRIVEAKARAFAGQ